ncbi:MAG: PspA/IM30 family protein [Bryobacteraceae bacterium]
MALLERVATLMKANVNDLVDKAENPEKLLKQLLLDMQNQFMQVKTQVAIAIADQHLLENKQKENLEHQNDWVRKAELALEKGQEDLARVALERSLTHESAAHNFSQQIEDQSHQVSVMRDALNKLEQKMAETKAKTELLIAQHRRARVLERSGVAVSQDLKNDATFDRMREKVGESEALGIGYATLLEDNAEKRLAALDRADKVEQLLAELKSKRG